MSTAIFMALRSFCEHRFAPANPQGREIWAAQKVIRAHFGNLQRFPSYF